MQEEPELIGRRLGAGCAVGCEMRLPRLDVVLGRSAPAVDILVEGLGFTACEIGDDEAGVGTLGADFDAGDYALDTAPTGGAVNELLEPADFARLLRRFEARYRAGFQVSDMLAQRRGGRHAEDEDDTVGAAPVDDLRTAIVAVGPDQDLGVRPVAPDRPHQAAQVGADFCPTRPLGGENWRGADLSQLSRQPLAQDQDQQSFGADHEGDPTTRAGCWGISGRSVLSQPGRGQAQAYRGRQMVKPKIHEHDNALPGAKPNPGSRRLKTKVRKIFDTTAERRCRNERQEGFCSGEIRDINSCEMEGDRSAFVVAQGMNFGSRATTSSP